MPNEKFWNGRFSSTILPPMARQKEFDKDQALEKAMHQFWQKGYEATSVRDLIQALGISSSSMYDTFGDKQAIYLAALQKYRTIEYALFAQMLSDSTSLQETIQLLFDRLIDNLLADEDQRGSFTVNAIIELGARDPQVADQIQQHFTDISQLFAIYINKAQQDGKLSNKHNPADLARFLLYNMYSLSSMVRIHPNRTQMEGISTVVVSILEE